MTLRNRDFMIRLNKKWSLIYCFVFVWNFGNSQNLFNASNSKKFAKYLYSTQQYNLAANEYERIISIQPNDTNTYIDLLTTYRAGNICHQSIPNLNNLQINNYLRNNKIASEYLKLLLTCNCCYEKTDFNSALNSLDRSKQVFYKAGQFTFYEKKDSLVNFVSSHNEILQNNYPDVYSNLKRIEAFKGKEPALAVAMSTILPGSGKAYSGFWGDAVMSLIFVSTNAWLAYQGFEKKGIKSANGWIFGSISMGFYLGNIWGSGRAAKTYNRTEYEKIYNETKNSFYNHF